MKDKYINIDKFYTVLYKLEMIDSASSYVFFWDLVKVMEEHGR